MNCIYLSFLRKKNVSLCDFLADGRNALGGERKEGERGRLFLKCRESEIVLECTRTR